MHPERELTHFGWSILLAEVRGSQKEQISYCMSVQIQHNFDSNAQNAKFDFSIEFGADFLYNSSSR